MCRLLCLFSENSTVYTVQDTAQYVFKVLPKKVLFFALWRQLKGKAAFIFKIGTVVEKRRPLSWEKVL